CNRAPGGVLEPAPGSLGQARVLGRSEGPPRRDGTATRPFRGRDAAFFDTAALWLTLRSSAAVQNNSRRSRTSFAGLGETRYGRDRHGRRGHERRGPDGGTLRAA